MNAADVIGYVDTEAGDVYCPACNPSSENQPIFADSETDSWKHCLQCEELIPEELTGAGVEETQDRIEKFLVSRKGRPEIIRQWAQVLEDYFGPHDKGKVLCELARAACNPETLAEAERRVTRPMRTRIRLVLDRAGECPECYDPTCGAVRALKQEMEKP